MSERLDAAPLERLTQGAIDHLPGLLLYGGLLVGAVLAAVALDWVTRSLVRRTGLEVALERVGAPQLLYRLGYHHGTARLLGYLVRWVVILIALLVVAESAGLHQLADGFRAVVGYLPRVLASAAFLLVGLWAAGVARAVVGAATARDQEQRDGAPAPPGLIAQVVYWAVVVVSVVLTADQLGLETGIINALLQVAAAGGALALALAVGLGARDAMSNVVARTYMTTRFHRGDRLEVGAHRGVVRAHASTALVLRTDDGDVNIPYSVLMREVTISDAANTADGDEDAETEPADA